MQYHGKLFGHIPGTRKYFETGKTSVDWDNMERENIALKNAMEVIRCDAFTVADKWLHAQPEGIQRIIENIRKHSLANVEVCDGGRKTSELKQDANRYSQH